MKKWNLISMEGGAFQQKGFKAMLLRAALCWVSAGKWRACGWSVVQLDYDGELGLLHGVYASTDAELEVQAHHQEGRAGGLLQSSPSRFMSTTKELLIGQMKSIDPKAGDADLWIKIWKCCIASRREKY